VKLIASVWTLASKIDRLCGYLVVKLIASVRILASETDR